MNVYKISLLFFFGFMASVYCENVEPKSIYDITINDFNGTPVQLSKYHDKVMLIVNYAWACGFRYTSLDSLVELAKHFKDSPFKLLMIPSNSFGQNLLWTKGSAKELAEKGFDVFEQVPVTGDNTHPLYVFLTKQKEGKLWDGIKWNFTKFLVDKNGNVIERYSPTVSASEITERINDILMVPNSNGIKT